MLNDILPGFLFTARDPGRKWTIKRNRGYFATQQTYRDEKSIPWHTSLSVIPSQRLTYLRTGPHNQSSLRVHN